jgi:hypothetical protein
VKEEGESDSRNPYYFKHDTGLSEGIKEEEGESNRSWRDDEDEDGEDTEG